MTTYFGFAVSDSMFDGDVTIIRKRISSDEARERVAGAVVCLNSSHAPTVEAMRAGFGIEVEIPDKAPIVELEPGDVLILMGARGLPRLECRHEYSSEEIDKAEFDSAEWKILPFAR